ncbi:MAG: hypothetical protein AAFZ15_20045 [Bacteroidota bacterium]
MPIELAGIKLNRIHKIVSQEQADFVAHRIPGLDGNVVQNMGRDSVVLYIEGIFYGATAKDDLEKLRDVYKGRKEVDFLADLVGQAYFSQVIVKKFEVWQRAEDPDQFSYLLTLAEYVPPPEPESDFGFPDVELDIGLEALDFMDMIQLPDLLSVPELSDPSAPLLTMVDGVGGVLNGMTGPAEELSNWYGGGTNSKNIGRSARTASGSTSISANININVDTGQLLSMIVTLVEKLSGSDTELSNLFENPPEGVGETGNFLTSLSPPDIDQTNVLQSAFGEISDLIPTDISFIIGPMSSAITGFFGGLSINLTGDITRIIEGFEAIITLTQIDFSLEVDPQDGDSTAAKMTGRASRNTTVSGESIEALEDIKAYLELIPDPLDVSVLLETMLSGLQKLPRHRYPLRYLPLIDELTEKLETVANWKNLDAKQLSLDLSSSVQKLQSGMNQLFYEECIEKTTDLLEDLSFKVEGDNLIISTNILQQGLNNLADMVNAGNLSGVQAELDKLKEHQLKLENRTAIIQANLMQGQIDHLEDDLATLGDQLHARMLQLIADLDPPSDLPLLGILIQPLNQMLDEIGFNALLEKVKETFDKVIGFIDQLDLSSMEESFSNVIGGAVDAIEGLRQELIGATVELTVVMNSVENAIKAIKIEEIVAGMKQALEGFQELIENGVNAVFQPVREILSGTLATIDSLLTQFNPALLIEELRRLLQILTSVLSDPQMLNALDTVKSSLDSANVELGKFTFKPVADTVVQAINIAEGALDLTLSLPLPDSLRSDLEEALGALPSSLHPTADAINNALDEVVEQGPKPILVAIRDAPAELKSIVESYSPSNFIGENLTRPYSEFLTTLEKNTPGKLLEPVDKAVDDARETVKREANPEKLLQPLQGGYDELMGVFDQIDPHALIQPLQEQLTQGIKTVTDALPFEALNEVSDKLNEVTGQFQQVVHTGTTLKDLLQSAHDKLAGLTNAESQVRNYGDSIAAKIDTLEDLQPFNDSMAALAIELDRIKASPLQQAIAAPLGAAIAQLESLQPKQRLVSLIAARTGFPMGTLQNLPDSVEKSSLLSWLSDFNPMDEKISLPLNKLDDWRESLLETQAGLPKIFTDWDARYFSPNSPLEELRDVNFDPSSLRELLKETIQKQLMEALAPMFKAVDHFSTLFAGIIQEITALVDNLNAKLVSLLNAANSLDALFTAVNNLVETLENFDITFIADEVEDVFNAVKGQLEQLNPATIAAILKEAFDNLLNLLDLDTLLGLDELDSQYKQILDNLRASDPTKLLAEVVQPEYDKIPAFLQRLDLSVQINTLIEILESLQVELEGELGRTADAYDAMVNVIPADLQASLSVNASVSVG